MAMGDHLRDAFGDAVYTFGFTSYEGSWGYPLPDQPVNILAPMHEASLDGRFVAAGINLGIVDLRHPGTDGDWLREEFISRPRGHVSHNYRWRESLDALVFIRTMTPSTPWAPGGGS